MLKWSIKDEDENLVLKGTLNFDMYQCFVEHVEKREFKVSINGNSREFWFRCDSETEASNWVQIIQLHINYSKGHKEMAKVPHSIKFWKQEQITEEQFIKKAETFDILLFQTNTNSGRMIRTYTGGEFDHAALIIRFETLDDDVFLLEASSN